MDVSANLDFLPAPAVVMANLLPDKDGVVIIPRKDLGEGQDVHVVAVNPGNAAYRELVLPCGHYSTGKSPFKWMDGMGMARFLATSL